uniref:B3 domain-containing protein REM12 n=1 Tax=Noccaea caerulescens TaxID=107243 RepID=A0A1J3DHV0_NOCCA
MVTLLGKDGIEHQMKLLVDKAQGDMSLGKGWKDFAKANGLKTGDSITVESIWEGTTPVLSLLRIESTSDRASKDSLSLSTEPCSGKKTKKAENNREGSISMEVEKRKYLPTRRDSSSEIQNRIVILTLRPEDIRDCKLHLPSQFMRTNDIIKPGKITLLGRSGMKWYAYLLSKDGTVALGNGWKGFCEANGVMVGESFILEFIHREDTNLVFKFCSYFGDQTTYIL